MSSISSMNSPAALMILAGALLVAIGLLWHFGFLGKLPGDFVIERGSVKLYLPLATSIILSILASIVLFIVSRVSK